MKTSLLIKRMIDIGASTIALLVLLPLLALISLAIYLEDKQMPLFTHKRYGRNEMTFKLLKFRTMPKEERQIEDMENDNRVTRVGKFLRVFHLDELPQLVNIIKGDMGIVGPRPIPTDLPVKDITNWQTRSTIRPGLTGLAQIHCTKYTILRYKFRFDALYIKRMNLWLDTKLVIATAWKIRSLLAFTLWSGAILAATLSPLSDGYILSLGLFAQADKLAHLLMFSIMGFVAVWFGRSFLSNYGQIAGFALMWGLLLAGVTEYVQSFIPLRTMSLLDFAADAAGIGFAVMIVLLRLETNVERKAVKAS